jgi:hypothetical protein
MWLERIVQMEVSLHTVVVWVRLTTDSNIPVEEGHRLGRANPGIASNLLFRLLALADCSFP